VIVDILTSLILLAFVVGVVWYICGAFKGKPIPKKRRRRKR